MSAWLLRAVACGSLLALPATARRAGAAAARRARSAGRRRAIRGPRLRAPGAGELDRALAAQDWPRAEQLLAQAIERSPRSSALLKQIAGVFLADRRPLNAAIALKKAEALAPLDPESRFRLVLAYVAMGQREWARPELERLVAAAPETAIYRYWLGRLDYDAGQYAAAVAHLQAAAIRDPSFPRTFDNLGLCYEALNQIDLAIAQYREAVRLNRLAADPSPWPAINLGSALARGGAYEEAETVLREAVRIDPAAAPAQYHLGTVLEQTNRPDEAIKALRAAADADPAYADPLYALAADLPPPGTDRRRRRRAGRLHGAPRRPETPRRGRSGVEAVTGARLLVAAVALVRWPHPLSPRRAARSARGPARAGAGAAHRARRDRGRARARRPRRGEGGHRSGDRRVSRGSGRPQPRRRDRRAARRVAGRRRITSRRPSACSRDRRRPTSTSDGCSRSAPAPIPRRAPAALAVYARLLAIDPRAARGAVPDRGARGARRPLRRGAAGDRSAARGGAWASAVLAVRAVVLAGSGDADGARTRHRRARRASAAGPRGHRGGVAGARAPARARHRAGAAGAARSARLGHAGGAAPSRRDRERRAAATPRPGPGSRRLRRGASPTRRC